MKIKRNDVIKALRELHPDKLDRIAESKGVSEAIKKRTELLKTVSGFDLNS
jgi:hypothetical protein